MGALIGTAAADRPDPDPLLTQIAEYVTSPPAPSAAAEQSAHWVLLDSLACALLALEHEECVRHLGPVVPGTVVPHGAVVPGTGAVLDPIAAAFDIGCMIRWLDFNDTWLAAEWGHPSDNLGAILGVGDYLSRRAQARGDRPLMVADVLARATQAHEIQGVLALTNSFNAVGLDHVLLVRIASTAVSTALLGGTTDQVAAALSHAFADGGALRTYRHAPNTGPRKSWAAGDATSRAVRHAMWAVGGEISIPSVLTAAGWGFQDVLFGGTPIELPRPLGSYVMENVLFKVSFPAEFHAQTAVEAAFELHPQVRDRIDEVESVTIWTQEAGKRIIDKTGPLTNYADRDHCIQYMTAIGLIFGELTADSYTDAVAADPRIDALRDRTTVIEEPAYSADYLDPDKRAITNAVQVTFTDGTRTAKVEVEYPVGHPRRRGEAIPLLRDKLADALARRFPEPRVGAIMELADDPVRLAATPLPEFIDLFVPDAAL